MRKVWVLVILFFWWLLLVWCNKKEKLETILDDECSENGNCLVETQETEQFVSYYDNWAIRETWTYIDWMKQWMWITYDEGWNVIDIQEYNNWELVNYNLDNNVLSVNEDGILSTDELKKLCEENLKEIEPDNPETERSEEKLFVNTYWFRWYTTSDGLHNGSPTYCNITLDWLVLSNWFFRDQWQSIEQLHEEMDFNNVWWIGNNYPNLKEFYWFVGNIILWDRIQTTYITGKNTLYFDDYRWIALRLWEEFDLWLIREIDTDETGYPHSEIIFLVKGNENEENRTGINWYREIFTITAISKQILEDFKITPEFRDSIIWENNHYIFTISKLDTSNNYYSDLQIFNIEQ